VVCGCEAQFAEAILPGKNRVLAKIKFTSVEPLIIVSESPLVRHSGDFKRWEVNLEDSHN